MVSKEHWRKNWLSPIWAWLLGFLRQPLGQDSERQCDEEHSVQEERDQGNIPELECGSLGLSQGGVWGGDAQCWGFFISPEFHFLSHSLCRTLLTGYS